MLVDNYIQAVTHGKATQLCSLLANSSDPSNPGQKPNEPYSAADKKACEDNTTFADVKSSTLRIGSVVVKGDQALVSIIGQVCSQQQGCSGTSNPSLGMPGPTTGTFAQILDSNAGTGGGTGSGPNGDVLACQQIAGRWYVLDDSSDSS